MLIAPLPDPYLSDLRTHLCLFEGRIPWLYLDGPGNVTGGVGHLFRTFADACVWLPMLTIAEWDAVRNADPDQPATCYSHLSIARMSQNSIDTVLDADITAKGAGLASVLPASAQAWPGAVKQALYDFAFNIGAHGLVAKFPKMLAAIEAGDYKTAAAESERKGIQPARNEYVRNLLISALA